MVSSPALWRALVEGTASTEVALTRYLVSVLVCWAVLGLVAMLVGPAPKPEPERDPESEHDEASEVPQEAEVPAPVT